jgi:phenylpropionate dioxygenase-like ring-hydroxylating dioxygenase large terminal subunit
MLNGTEFCKNYANRGQTIHDIRCHLQDIPENGADTFHFKYVHRYLIGRFKMLEVAWKPKWKRGDDPDLPELFEHPTKSVQAFKQRIFTQLIQPLENKQYYSFGSVDSYVLLPIIGPTFFFNITIVQMGPALVNVFLKTHFCEVVFFQYIQPQGPYHQRLFHEMFCSAWMPHWLCYIMLYAEGMQVFYDMLVWDAKKFGHKICLKDNEADRFIRAWR